MYKEYDETIINKNLNILALDWDETTSDYPLAFKELAKRFERVIIVTVNDELTLDYVCEYLKRTPQEVQIFCCPNDNLEKVAEWKAQICSNERVAIMFDDNPNVVRACHNLGVNAIYVNERTWKFQ